MIRLVLTEDANQELVNIFERDGALQPSVVVEEARFVDSSLHSYFEWSDEKCGIQFRLIQARNICKKAVLQQNDETLEFLHVPKVEYEPGESREGVYKPFVVMTPSERELALAELETQLAQAIRPLDRIAELNEEPEKRPIIARARKHLALTQRAVTELQ